MDEHQTDQNKNDNIGIMTAKGAGALCMTLLFAGLAAAGLGIFMMPFYMLANNPTAITEFQHSVQGF